jgi:PAS domain S-box-containing protein
MPLSPRLYWQDGWHMLSELPLAGGRSLRLDLALADFNRQFARMNKDGLTREVRVCSRASATEMACFPSRLNREPMRLPLAPGAEPLPIQMALAGQSGVAAARDYRGEQVIAAFGTMPGTGLGLVQKIDTDEFYSPLRKQLWYALFGMAVLILAGASVLYLRTHPLVLGLVRTRARLDAILNNVPAGVLTFDEAGVILSANRAAAEMFGYARGALLGMRMAELLDDADGLLQPQLARLHQLAGRRRDGTPLALEVLANEFMLGKAKKRIAIVQDVGERLRMEQALRQREASLAHAQQLAHIGSWERDLAANTYFWSDQTYRVFALEPGAPAPSYDEVLALVHPEDRALKQLAEAEAVAGLRDYDVTFRVALPGGAVKVIHSRAETEFDGAGRALRMRGTIQDITEKTWADEQIRKREEEYRALVENSPDVVVRFDRALRCVYVNPAIERAPGLAAVIGHGRVLGDSEALLARPWTEAVRTAFAGSRAAPFEVVAARCHYQVQVVPEFRQGGQVTAVLATARDITAIRSGEAVLRQSEERLTGIAANTPGAVFQSVSRRGELVFTYVSGGVAQLFGESPEAVLADPGRLLGHIAAADRTAFHSALARCGRNMRMLNWEGRASGAGGREIWINCRASPRRAGEATIWEGLMLNITASKRNELELTESRQLLRELSAHRERVREEERKKIAREVHDELGQALTALRMDVALLRMADGPHSPALLARVAAMKEAVDRTIGIVRNVTSALRPAALDLGLTAALEWQVEDFARRSGIECMLHADETEVVLDDDQATALFRIVQESLTNVLKHAHASHVEVTLEARTDCICLEVSDNGRGFAADGPLRGRFGLVGMRERVLVLGGTVQVNSAAGEGTTVSVRLPLANEQGARALEQDE